jgi:hypothetical protein
MSLIAIRRVLTTVYTILRNHEKGKDILIEKFNKNPICEMRKNYHGVG